MAARLWLSAQIYFYFSQQSDSQWGSDERSGSGLDERYTIFRVGPLSTKVYLTAWNESCAPEAGATGRNADL